MFSTTMWQHYPLSLSTRIALKPAVNSVWFAFEYRSRVPT